MSIRSAPFDFRPRCLLISLTALLGLLGPGFVRSEPPAASGDGGTIRLLFDAPGSGGGGRMSGGPVTLDSAMGGPVSGGVSKVSNLRETGGFTGQLVDPDFMVVTVTPGTTLNEGDAVQLTALITWDDQSTGETTSGVQWSTLEGPVSVNVNGLVRSLPVTADTMARVRGAIGAFDQEVALSIINEDFAPSTITWNDPGDGGPFTVFFGTIANPPQVATPNPDLSFFNPGQLEMGQQYFFQVFDQNNNDITPGGPGVQSFTTSLFQPDMRIGTKGNPATHKRDDLYNRSGAGQVAKIKMIGRRKGKLFFSLENDGDTIDDTKIRGTKASRKFKFIKYFRLTDGRANVTSAMIRAGYTQEDMDPGDMARFQIQAKAKGKRRARQTLRIGATSASDARGIDLAKGKLKGLVKKRKKRRR